MSIPDRVVLVELESWMSALWHRKCLSSENRQLLVRCARRQRPQPYDRYRRQFESCHGNEPMFQNVDVREWNQWIFGAPIGGRQQSCLKNRYLFTS